MTLELQSLNASGETQYISKHNSNYTAIASAINALQESIGGGKSAAGTLEAAYFALFGPDPGIIGINSFVPTVVGTTVSFSNGYYWNPLYRRVDTLLAFDTYPPVFDFFGEPPVAKAFMVANGTWTFPTVDGTLGTPHMIWHVVWDGITVTVTRGTAIKILWGQNEWGDAKISTTLGTFTTLDERLEAIEDAVGSTPGSSTQAANKVFVGPASGTAALPTFRSLVIADLPHSNDTSFADDSAVNVPTRHAVKGYVEAAIATATGGLGTGSVTSVNLTAPAAGITVSGGPITSSGSITLALANDLAALEALSGTGIPNRTGSDTWSLLTLDTDTALAANSDTRVASQKAAKAYVDTLRTAPLGVFYPGKPTANEVLLRYTFTIGATLPQNATGSDGDAGTAATGSTTFTLKKNGSSVGTFNFAASATTPTFTVASPVSFAAGDILTIEGPGTADATLADFNVQLLMTRA